MSKKLVFAWFITPLVRVRSRVQSSSRAFKNFYILWSLDKFSLISPTPKFLCLNVRRSTKLVEKTGAAGLEPATRSLEGCYSIHLSYAPTHHLSAYIIKIAKICGATRRSNLRSKTFKRAGGGIGI